MGSLIRIQCSTLIPLLLAAGVSAQDRVSIQIDPAHALSAVSPFLTGACLEDVNHEVYGGLYSQMIFGESFAEPASSTTGPQDAGVSGMWRSFSRGAASGTAALDVADPFVGSQSQRIHFGGGSGVFGIENRGLNRQGLGLLAGRVYEGHLWAACDARTPASVELASADGSHVYAACVLSLTDSHWRQYDFTLTPSADDPHARFEVGLTAPGSVRLGYVFLSPGSWGTFHNLPVRRDVAEALVKQGITVLRYGGSMVNAPEYRWKKMVGDRDRRPPYNGHWYPHASNGWGVADFLNFAEAAHVLAIPDFNIDETPQAMADFLDYANGPAASRWGKQRVKDGHPEPYRLTHLELGNEERVDDTYFAKFAGIARALWSKDPSLVLTVGDFEYTQPIVDPMHVTGASSHITSLAAHQKILALAKQFGAEVCFDVHVFTEAPPPSGPLLALPTYVDAIDTLAGGAKHKVVVYELNAGNHSQQRALANAQALIRIEQDGRVPVVASANCLQVDGQNNNGWDQGLLFLNPLAVWLQPPGQAMQMFSQAYQPTRIATSTSGAPVDGLEIAATASADHTSIVLQIVNTRPAPALVSAHVLGWKEANGSVRIRTLAGALSAANTAQQPEAIRPVDHALPPSPHPADVETTLPPDSFTLIQWQPG